jgi:hypothetical protein
MFTPSYLSRGKLINFNHKISQIAEKQSVMNNFTIEPRYLSGRSDQKNEITFTDEILQVHIRLLYFNILLK